MTTFQIGDRVQIVNTRFALAASPRSWDYQELWRKYGNRIGIVEGHTTQSPHLPGANDADAYLIRFEDGDSIAWESHLIRKVATE